MTISHQSTVTEKVIVRLAPLAIVPRLTEMPELPAWPASSPV
jgi:hypothetical protein